MDNNHPASGERATGDPRPSVVAEPTPGPWEYVPSTEHHGPYVTSQFGSTICDLYVMTANGGPSKPILFLHEMADPNARLIAAAPEMLAALHMLDGMISAWAKDQGFPREQSACWQVVRTAIAKATSALPDRSEPTQSQAAR